MLETILIAGTIAGTLTWTTIRDHRKARAKRADLLDGVTHLFDNHVLKHGGDSFPEIAGRIGGRKVDVRLVCDTMTMRRLPQLWLQVTALEKVPTTSGFAVLVRPSNYEFYSLTGEFHHVIEPPPSFPSEVIVRAERPDAIHTFRMLTPAVAAILADPRVKEVAVTRQGLRIIRQASEGRRGEHLLLRQAVFDDAAVSAEALESVLAEIAELRTSLHPQESAVA